MFEHFLGHLWGVWGGRSDACFSLESSPHKALPDWKKDAPRGSRRLPLASEMDEHEKGLAEFMSFHASAPGSKPSRAQSSDTQRISNQFFLQCLDHALLGGTGLSLAYFRVDQPWRPPAPP